MMEYKVIGKRLPRHDALLQVTGRAIYGDDVVRPGMLYAKALRSSYAHAKILQVDTSAAERLPGVKAVITAKDVPFNRFGFTHLDQPILADDKVRYRGDALAVVAAECWEAAEEALGLIKVDYEPLPAVFDPIEAMKPEAPKVHGDTNIVAHIKIRYGDVEQGWREADEIIEETLTTQMVEHAHIEPHAAVAEVSPQGEITVWSSVQRPFLVAADLSKILGLPMNKIRVISTAVGGGFGGKNEITMEPWICLLAMKTRRPVKMVYTREEEFQATTVRHPYITKYKTGVKRDGTLVARQVEIISDCGAYVSWGYSTLTKASIHAAGPYRIPHVRIDAYLVYTNNNVGGAMRGFGVPQLGFAYEVHTDTIAAALGMDPIEFRLKNILEDNSALPTGQVLEIVTLKETIRRAIEIAGWRKEVNIP
ncbi:MAG: molybdopterin-dependent oxidoreductase [Syntrophothermus sp.]|uniref:xanthine dehydrogenase family protein molybdopterin-binding subunit n=1 Tax=Syntrophothermus sp. TaxID=2736299 RepID=UPI00338FAABD|nr:molybdopterin-dependent oxidoreductase [Syntrophothermus sp.]